MAMQNDSIAPGLAAPLCTTTVADRPESSRSATISMEAPSGAGSSSSLVSAAAMTAPAPSAAPLASRW